MLDYINKMLDERHGEIITTSLKKNNGIYDIRCKRNVTSLEPINIRTKDETQKCIINGN